MAVEERLVPVGVLSQRRLVESVELIAGRYECRVLVDEQKAAAQQQQTGDDAGDAGEQKNASTQSFDQIHWYEGEEEVDG